MKMAFNVGADRGTAVPRAAISWVYPGRRSEIGSHIFIRGGAPSWRMENSYEIQISNHPESSIAFLCYVLGTGTSCKDRDFDTAGKPSCVTF